MKQHLKEMEQVMTARKISIIDIVIEFNRYGETVTERTVQRWLSGESAPNVKAGAILCEFLLPGKRIKDFLPKKLSKVAR